MHSITKTRRTRGHGFTLIELMIVVAIIGILAAVAIPAYQTYVAKSKFGAALHEASGGKTGVETRLNDSETPTLANIGLPVLTDHCASVVTGSVTGQNVIQCTIQGGPSAVDKKTIILTRAINADGVGEWTCTTTVAQSLAGPAMACKEI